MTQLIWSINERLFKEILPKTGETLNLQVIGTLGKGTLGGGGEGEIGDPMFNFKEPQTLPSACQTCSKLLSKRFKRN